MHELAIELDRCIEHLIESEGWKGQAAIVCALQAVGQTAMHFHYGNDGVARFNRLQDSHDHGTPDLKPEEDKELRAYVDQGWDMAE